ncbi:hypothetical protein [Streptomyces sp. NPDC096324]|uniref:hypothetical protein n=1 Tax=Streptomyces sp. NPDC096324 TaxID=3366085 RepID=UPI003809C45E
MEFTAQLALELLPDDRAAVAALLAAQRRQSVSDILRQQKTDALAAELTHLIRHRPENERSVEYEAVEVLREFLASFPDHTQKRMLYTLMAAGMDSAQRPHHSAKAQALVNGHAAAEPEGAS